MSILDFHAKNLCPSVWEPDGTKLTGRFYAALFELLEQFPNAQRCLLIGNSVSHYWLEDSDIDVVLLMAPEDVEKAQYTARVGRFKLDSHIIKLFVMPSNNNARDLAERFGPIYCVDTVSWHGVVAHDTGELLRPSGLVRRISWLLYRILDSLDLTPDWKIEITAFEDMKPISRNDTLTELNRRIILADHELEHFLPTLTRDEWKKATEFETQLNESGEVPELKINKKVQALIIDIYRRRDLYETLQERHDRLEVIERAEIRGAGVKTALTIDMMAGDWYKTKLELFPLIYIRNIHRDASKMAIGSDDYDDDVRLVDFEFVGADGIATMACATLKEVKGFGLTKADDKDFEDLGLVAPTPMVQAPQ